MDVSETRSGYNTVVAFFVTAPLPAGLFPLAALDIVDGVAAEAGVGLLVDVSDPGRIDLADELRSELMEVDIEPALIAAVAVLLMVAGALPRLIAVETPGPALAAGLSVPVVSVMGTALVAAKMFRPVPVRTRPIEPVVKTTGPGPNGIGAGTLDGSARASSSLPPLAPSDSPFTLSHS